MSSGTSRESCDRVADPIALKSFHVIASWRRQAQDAGRYH
jgi:hypothetical protein